MELKVIRPRELVMAGKHNEPVYLKPDADAVIAELENKLQNESRLLKETREWLIESQKLHKRCADNAVKIIRHYKYHRCLDKAKILEQESMIIKYRLKNEEWLDKWHKRWLELAEKYKHKDDGCVGSAET